MWILFFSLVFAAYLAGWCYWFYYLVKRGFYPSVCLIVAAQWFIPICLIFYQDFKKWGQRKWERRKALQVPFRLLGVLHLVVCGVLALLFLITGESFLELAKATLFTYFGLWIGFIIILCYEYGMD